MKKKTRIIIRILIVLLLLILGVSVWQLLRIRRQYKLEESAHRELLVYRPSAASTSGTGSTPKPVGTDSPADSSERNESGETSESDSTDSSDPSASSEPTDDPVVNNSILLLQADHPNAVGWLTVPGTDVDYPFVQGPDNKYFLRRDIDGKYLYAGIPFLDWQCRPDFSGDNTIIYGHNLRNGTMFGTLERFKDQSFLNRHHEVFVYLPTQTIRAEIAACLVISPRRYPYPYSIQPEADHLERALADARTTREIPSTPEQRFITLSTCDYEYNGARVIILAVIDE